MSAKILEPCCYRRQLGEWWHAEQRQEHPADAWPLFHFGDVMLTGLIDWCVSMCSGGEMGVDITIAMPTVSEELQQQLASMQQRTMYSQSAGGSIPLVRRLRIITGTDMPRHYLHLVTVSGNDTYFALHGNLLQQKCEGNFIITMGITRRYYDACQQRLESLYRVYCNPKQ